MPLHVQGRSLIRQAPSKCFQRERTRAGLDAACARGRTESRRKAIEALCPEQVDRAKELYAVRQNSVAEIMALTGFKSRATFYKYVVNAGKQG